MLGVDDWSVTGFIQDLTLADISTLYKDLFGDPLVETGQNIRFNMLSVGIGKAGFYLKGQVSIDKHTSTDAMIAFTDRGLIISGGIENFDVPGGVVTIHTAHLDIVVGRGGSAKRELKFGIMGKVSIDIHPKLDFEVTLLYHRTPEGCTEWLVYGALQADLPLRSFAPDIPAGSFLDISLKQLAIVVSNQDNPEMLAGSHEKFLYPVKNGLQICAMIEKLDPINSLTKPDPGSSKDLLLSIGWTKDGNGKNSFTFDITVPTKGVIKPYFLYHSFLQPCLCHARLHLIRR